MKLFFHQTGPLVRYRDGTLYVSDLNPEVNTKWTMSRAEMLAFGLRAILASMVPAPRYKKYAAWPVVLWCRFTGHRDQPKWNEPERCLRCGDHRTQ